MKTRLCLGAVGAAAMAYGGYRYLTLQLPADDQIRLVIWLAVAVLVHDAVLAPLVVALDWAIRRVFRRATAVAATVQALLVAGGLTSALGGVLIWRARSPHAAPLALLQQNYVANLGIVLVVQAALVVLAVLVAGARARNWRPPWSQRS